MRRRFPLLIPLVLLGLAGCDNAGPVAGALVGADLASVTVFGRGVGDMAVSALSGRDCSIVHLDAGQTWCRPPEPPPSQPRYCTRSLGVVDCWADPAMLPGHPPEVADGPRTLTAAQERNRTAPWLSKWLGL
jgi:hypothetical protein